MTVVDLTKFSDLLMEVSEAELATDVTLGGRLVLSRAGDVAVSYAPFDYIERGAKFVIVGITPGAQQARNALVEARRQLIAGASVDTALKAAKTHASFSGPMRTNLVAMLDQVGLNRSLGIATTAEVWTTRSDLVHFTSVLRYPVFLSGKNYTGSPSMTAVPILKALLDGCLAGEANALAEALWVPLGPTATEGLGWLVKQGSLPKERVLIGLPHPSGANAERIAYFLGRKARSALSTKTNADKLDVARTQLTEQIKSLPMRSIS